jgi:hypothetical protein
MKEKKSGGFTLPFIIMAVASTAIGGGYDTVCVVSAQNQVSCTDTTTLSKFMSSAGMSNNFPDVEFELQPGEEPALLICNDGDYYPIGIDGGNIIARQGDTTLYQVNRLPPCPAPQPPRGNRLYGPADGRGGHFCNGRASSDNCKDCCIGVSLGKAGMVATAGKLYRDTKPPPQGLIIDGVVEVAAYGLIYLDQQQCNNNCEVSYER